jgi:hypothetical protein
VVQYPNKSLTLFIVLSVTLDIFHPTGAIETLIRVSADVALFAWAIDELLRGVNPFRRGLGLVVIVASSVALLLQMH